MRLPFGGVRPKHQVRHRRRHALQHVAADQHQRGTEPRQLDQIGHLEILVGVQEMQREVARISGEIGGVVFCQPQLDRARDIGPVGHSPRIGTAQYAAVGMRRHRLDQRKHIVGRKVDVGVDKQHMGAVAGEEHRRQHVARARDRRLIEDEFEPHRHTHRLRAQRQSERGADIGALRPFIDRRRHHQAAIGKGGVGCDWFFSTLP